MKQIAYRLRALLHAGGEFSIRSDVSYSAVGYIASGKFHLRIPFQVLKSEDSIFFVQRYLADVFDRWGDGA